MSLSPITFPAREESRVTKIYKAIGRFETNYPNLTMYIAWAALGVVLVISVAVQR
jgi:hypothetical protein